MFPYSKKKKYNICIRKKKLGPKKDELRGKWKNLHEGVDSLATGFFLLLKPINPGLPHHF
jgi:hypothetical protein